MKLNLTAPHTVYKRSDGTRLQGVTTILGVIGKPQLLGWYASMEREGVLRCAKDGAPLPVKKDGKPLWFAEAKRDKAADLGTVTHAQCEAWLTNDPLVQDGIPPEVWAQSLHGLERFKAWWGEAGFTLLHSERVLVYDDGHMCYGGTADILARDTKGRVVLVDLKTTKASPWWPYDETYAQVAAYAEAAGNDPNTAIDVERIIVARIGKEAGDELQTVELTHRQHEAGWALFKAAYAASEAKRALEKARK